MLYSFRVARPVHTAFPALSLTLQLVLLVLLVLQAKALLVLKWTASLF